MTTARFSRRQVLAVAGMTLGVGAVELGGLGIPATAAPGDPQITLVPVGAQPVRVLCADGAAPTVCPKQLAVKVLANGLALPAGTRIALTFDPRLFAPVRPAAVTLGGRAAASRTETTVDRNTGLTTSTVTLSAAVPAAGGADLLVVAGTAKPLAYPNDIVRQPKDAAADAVPSGRYSHARRTLQPGRPGSFGGPVEPWGISLGGVWRRQTWGADTRYWYHYPAGVTVSATGPGRTPTGIAFAVAVDPQVVRDMAVASASLDGKPFRGSVRRVDARRTAGVYQTRWRASAALSPGQVLHVRFLVVTASLSGPLPTIKHPTITELMAAGAAQRTTGAESVSRNDSRWQ